MGQSHSNQCRAYQSEIFLTKLAEEAKISRSRYVPVRRNFAVFAFLASRKIITYVFSTSLNIPIPPAGTTQWYLDKLLSRPCNQRVTKTHLSRDFSAPVGMPDTDVLALHFSVTAFIRT